MSTLDLDRYGDLAKPDEAWVGPGLARHVALPQQGNAAAATVLSLSSIPGTTVWEDYRWPLKKVVEADGDFVRGGGFSARGGFINRPIEDGEDVGRARVERQDEDAILSDFWVSDLRAGRDRIETLSAPPGAKPWEDYVDQILVSKDGRTVVGFRDGVLFIWRRNTGWAFLRKLNVDYGLNPSMTSAGDLAAIAALSGSGDKLIYVAADQAIMRLDIGSGAVATLRAGKPSRRIVGLAYAESVQSIIFLELPERGKPAPEDERDDGLRLLSIRTGEERFVDDNFRGGSLLLPTISSDGSLLAALSLFDQTVRVWNAGTLKEIAVIKPESGTLGEIRFLGGGKFLASLSDNQLAVLSVETGRTLFVQSLDTHDWGRYVGVEVNASEDQLALVFEDKLALFDFSLLGAAPQAIVVRACKSLFGGAANFSRREIDADPVLGVVWPDHERELCPDATVGK